MAAIVVGAGLLLAPSASATTIEVETDGDGYKDGDTVCTLREAITASAKNQKVDGCPAGSKNDVIQLFSSHFLDIPEKTKPNAGGDLDYSGKGKLTIRGGDSFDPDPISNVDIVVPTNNAHRALEITKGKVKIEGVSISNVTSSEDAGGAIRVAGPKASLQLTDIVMSDNNADVSGGAIACEDCRRLAINGTFLIEGNSVGVSGFPQGGAIWTNSRTTIKGPGRVGAFGAARISDNYVNPSVGNSGLGGAIYTNADLSIKNTEVNDNSVFISGRGGGIAAVQPPEGMRLKLARVTLDDNAAESRGGGIDMAGTGGRLMMSRAAVSGNDSGGFGGGVFTQSDARVTDSIIDGNTLAGQVQGLAQGGGFYANTGNAPEPTSVSFVRTSVTNNELLADEFQQGAGIYTTGADLYLEGVTVSSNEAQLAGGDGGGIFAQENANVIPATGSAEIHFSTFRGNQAGAGGTDGDALYAAFADNPISIRSSIIDESSDGCKVSSGTDVVSGGFNVEEVIDTDCGLDAPTDLHGPDSLGPLQANGSAPVGAPASSPLPGAVPLTNIFVDDTSAAHDIVPSDQCRIDGSAVKSDARGVPRPVGEGCDAGATERAVCALHVVFGPGSRIGTPRDDTIGFAAGADNIALALGGDDQIFTSDQDDVTCAGAGDDAVYPGSGTDVIEGGPGSDLLGYVSYPTPVNVDLGAGTATGAGNDTFTSIEDAMGGNAGDTLSGSDGDNLLIGRDGADVLLGQGGIDFLDARDGEADAAIICGQGDNSLEKAKVDPGLDPQPVSC